ncbi:galactosylceramide sulfotransferase-like [Oculina patagonica]
MAIIVKWHKPAPSSPIFSRKFAVATIVLIIFVVYVANLGKMISVENQDTHITDEVNSEKFRTTSNSCQPKDNVLFLKTHKTGSSTITNILNRYGDLHNLTVALPQDGFYNFFWPLSFEKSFTADLRGKTPNILCNHARWNKQTMKELMAQEAAFITILRNPVSQFESTFSYMEFAHLLGIGSTKNPLATFFEDPNRTMAKISDFSASGSAVPYLHLLRNGQSFDLGLESAQFFIEEKTNDVISELDSNFDLVLMMEYFDESLVLLARELCWDIRDVVYFKLNQRRSSDLKTNLSEELAQKIRQWNRADVLLYNHFNRTFWNKVEKLGSAFWTDVDRLRYYNRVLEEACLLPGEHYTKAYAKQSKEIRGYALKKNLEPQLKLLCGKMITNEIDYIEYLRKIR